MLIHGYDDIDMDIIWHTVMEDVPALRTYLETIVEEAVDER